MKKYETWNIVSFVCITVCVDLKKYRQVLTKPKYKLQLNIIITKLTNT